MLSLKIYSLRLFHSVQMWTNQLIYECHLTPGIMSSKRPLQTLSFTLEIE